jgi:hypothetical protein
MNHRPATIAAFSDDPQGDDEAVIAEVHAVNQQGDEVEAVELRGLLGRELRRRTGDKAATTALLLVPRRVISGPSGSKRRAYCRVATPTSICSTTRRSSGSVAAIA